MCGGIKSHHWDELPEVIDIKSRRRENVPTAAGIKSHTWDNLWAAVRGTSFSATQVFQGMDYITGKSWLPVNTKILTQKTLAELAFQHFAVRSLATVQKKGRRRGI